MMSELIQLILGAVVAVLGTMAMIIFKNISDNIRTLTESVSALNVRIAVIIREVEQHSKRIERLEDR